jgi:hypothetical protein
VVGTMPTIAATNGGKMYTQHSHGGKVLQLKTSKIFLIVTILR